MIPSALATIASLAVHPGHGAGEGFGLWHYLTEPVHVLGGGAVLLCVGLAVAVMRRRARATVQR